MTPPSLPENFDELDESGQIRAKEVYRRRFVHYHYVKNTEECNELHYAALTDSMGLLCSRLFCHASNPWEGETLELKVALINAAESWETLTPVGGTPCPVVFDPEDVHETRKLDEVQRKADMTLETCQNFLGIGPEGWVPIEDYERVVALSKQMKADALAMATSPEERAEIIGHWIWDDMDEEKY